jgi:hypothetical protein
MKFAQIIEFTTGHIDEFNASLDEWMARSEGHRIPHRAVLRQDRDAQDHYLLMVEFASYEQGMETPAGPRPESSPRSWPGSAMARWRSATWTCSAKKISSGAMEPGHTWIPPTLSGRRDGITGCGGSAPSSRPHA